MCWTLPFPPSYWRLWPSMPNPPTGTVTLLIIWEKNLLPPSIKGGYQFSLVYETRQRKNPYIYLFCLFVDFLFSCFQFLCRMLRFILKGTGMCWYQCRSEKVICPPQEKWPCDELCVHTKRKCGQYSADLSFPEM